MSAPARSIRARAPERRRPRTCPDNGSIAVGVAHFANQLARTLALNRKPRCQPFQRIHVHLLELACRRSEPRDELPAPRNLDRLPGLDPVDQLRKPSLRIRETKAVHKSLLTNWMTISSRCPKFQPEPLQSRPAHPFRHPGLACPGLDPGIRDPGTHAPELPPKLRGLTVRARPLGCDDEPECFRKSVGTLVKHKPMETPE